MFNPDLKKLLKNCSSRYSLVVGVAERARQIRDDAVENDVLLDEKRFQLLLTRFITENMLLLSRMKLNPTRK